MESFVLYKNPKSYIHNPDVIRLANGEMLMAFREAPRRRNCTHIDPESKATVLRSRDHGQTWGDAVTAAEGGPNIGIQDPSITPLRDGRVICGFFTWDAPADAPYGAECPGTYLTISPDGGKTWDARRLIPVDVVSRPGAYSATTDAVVELAHGDLLLPVYENKQGRERSVVMRSADGGKTWRESGVMGEDPLDNVNFCEPALTLLPSGKLIGMLREERKKECLWQSDSADDGKTWTLPRRTPIWGFPADLLPLKSGKLLCTYGHRRRPYGVRACLSHDEGKTWDYENELVLCKNAPGPDVGYPSSVQLDDGTIFTAYYTSEPIGARGAASPDDPATHFADGGLRYLAGCYYKEW